MTGEDRKKGHFSWVGWLINISCLNSVQEIYVKEESCTVFPNWAWNSPPKTLYQEHRRKLWSQVWNWPFWAIKSSLMHFMGKGEALCLSTQEMGMRRTYNINIIEAKNICSVWKRWFTQLQQLYCFMFDQSWFQSLGLYPNPQFAKA